MKRVILAMSVACFLSWAAFAVDPLEYIALKRIENSRKPRIIRVPIYTMRQSYSQKFPLYVPIHSPSETSHEGYESRQQHHRGPPLVHHQHRPLNEPHHQHTHRHQQQSYQQYQSPSTAYHSQGLAQRTPRGHHPGYQTQEPHAYEIQDPQAQAQAQTQAQAYEVEPQTPAYQPQGLPAYRSSPSGESESNHNHNPREWQAYINHQ